MNHAPCRSCRRQVLWTKSAATGKPMPLDRDDEHGNVVLDGSGRAHVFRNNEAARAAIDTAPESVALDCSGRVYISHHAEGQCPQGRAWQGKKRTDPDAPKAPVQESLL